MLWLQFTSILNKNNSDISKYFQGLSWYLIALCKRSPALKEGAAVSRGAVKDSVIWLQESLLESGVDGSSINFLKILCKPRHLKCVLQLLGILYKHIIVYNSHSVIYPFIWHISCYCYFLSRRSLVSCPPVSVSRYIRRVYRLPSPAPVPNSRPQLRLPARPYLARMSHITGKCGAFTGLSCFCLSPIHTPSCSPTPSRKYKTSPRAFLHSSSALTLHYRTSYYLFKRNVI